MLGLAILCIARAGAFQPLPTRGVVIESGRRWLGLRIEPAFCREMCSRRGSWRPRTRGTPAVNGDLASPFDLDDVEIEQAPRGTVTLRGFRGDSAARHYGSTGTLAVACPPVVDRAIAGGLRERTGLAAKGRVEEAVDAWRAAANAAGDDAASAWLLMQAGHRPPRPRKKFDDAHGVINEALTAAERTAERAAIAGVQETQARIYERQNDVAKAEERYRAVVATRQGPALLALAHAKALVDQASMHFNRENLAGAEPLLRDAVDIQRKLAPGSVVLARSLTSPRQRVARSGTISNEPRRCCAKAPTSWNVWFPTPPTSPCR